MAGGNGFDCPTRSVSADTATAPTVTPALLAGQPDGVQHDRAGADGDDSAVVGDVLASFLQNENLP